MKPSFLPQAAGLLVLAVLSTRALAHAVLVMSDPPADARLTSSPAQLKLHFNEALEQKFSLVRLADAHGNTLAKGSGDPSATDPKGLQLALPRLGPGVYTVDWSAMTPDSHRTKGHYLFRVQ